MRKLFRKKSKTKRKLQQHMDTNLNSSNAAGGSRVLNVIPQAVRHQLNGQLYKYTNVMKGNNYLT